MCNVSVKLNRRRNEDHVPLVEGLSEVVCFNLDLNDCTDEALMMVFNLNYLRIFLTMGLFNLIIIQRKMVTFWICCFFVTIVCLSHI